MSNSSVNQISPGDLIAEYGVDPVRYHLLRDIPFGSRRRVLLRGHHRPLQRRPGQQSRQPGLPGGDGRRVQVRRPGTGRAGPTAAWPGWPTPWWPRPPRRGRRASPTLGLEATWRLIRETNAELEATEPWKSEPGAEVDAVLGSALEVLRIVSILVVPAMPSTAAEIWRRIGLEGSPADQRLPGAGGWGGLPGRAPGGEGGARSSPVARRSRSCRRTDAVIEWFDSHCHLQDEFAE